MPYVLRKFHCEICGAYVERKLSSKQPRQCAEHGIQRMISSVHQMSEHAGPAWEAFAASRGAKGRPRKTHEEE
jgi:hypothetical protein